MTVAYRHGNAAGYITDKCRCEECKDYSRQLYLKRTRPIRELIRKVKSVPCTDCGVEYAPYIMQFDHVRGEKSFGVATGPYRKLEDVLKEIEKCEIVCANCHAERTHSRGYWQRLDDLEED